MFIFILIVKIKGIVYMIDKFGLIYVLRKWGMRFKFYNNMWSWGKMVLLR